MPRYLKKEEKTNPDYTDEFKFPSFRISQTAPEQEKKKRHHKRQRKKTVQEEPLENGDRNIATAPAVQFQLPQLQVEENPNKRPMSHGITIGIITDSKEWIKTGQGPAQKEHSELPELSPEDLPPLLAIPETPKRKESFNISKMPEIKGTYTSGVHMYNTKEVNEQIMRDVMHQKRKRPRKKPLDERIMEFYEQLDRLKAKERAAKRASINQFEQRRWTMITKGINVALAESSDEEDANNMHTI